jgi:bifunctional non-homologous end joining protein LigD
VLPRVAARNRQVLLTFVAFDVLAYDGPMIDEPYSRRRALLDGLALNGPAWCTAPVLNGSVVDVLAACGEHDVEGMVAKRVDSPYRPGERSSDWLKVKTADWRTAHASQRQSGLLTIDEMPRTRGFR